MRLEQLQYFDTLIQTGSFTKAAAKLHITQPSLTASIKSMEKELDVMLVTRDVHGVTLTEEGLKVLAFAQAVLKMQEHLLHSLKADTPTGPQKITVFASNFFNRIVLENFISQYLHNDIFQIRNIEYELTPTLESFVINGCDFAVVSRLSTADESQCQPGMIVPDHDFFDPNFVYVPIVDDVFGICLSYDSALLHRQDVTPLNLAAQNHPVTMFPQRNLYLSDRVLFASYTIEQHVQAITKQNAVCTIPYFAYRYHFGAEDSITFRGYDNQITIHYYLIYPADHILTDAEKIFIDKLQRYLTEIKFK